MMKKILLLSIFAVIALSSCKKKYNWNCSCSVNLAAYQDLMYQELTEEEATDKCDTRKAVFQANTGVTSVDCNLLNLGEVK